MALTGCGDDSKSDDGVLVEKSEIEPEVVKGESAELSGLNATNLDKHNNNMNEETQQCNHPSKETKGGADETESEVKKEVLGAGFLFGLSGLVLGGPILALVAGVGATFAASGDKGPVGDAARGAGEFAVATGSKVGEAAKEVNEKHGILEKIQDALKCGWSKVQKFDEEHKATEKVKETMSDVGQKTVEFERKHHVGENILVGVQNGINFLLQKIRVATSDCNANTNGTS